MQGSLVTFGQMMDDTYKGRVVTSMCDQAWRHLCCTFLLKINILDLSDIQIKFWICQLFKITHIFSICPLCKRNTHSTFFRYSDTITYSGLVKYNQRPWCSKFSVMSSSTEFALNKTILINSMFDTVSLDWKKLVTTTSFFLNETQFTFFLCKADQNKANNTGNVDLINIFPKKHIQQDTVYIWSFLLKSKEIWIKNAISIKWRHGIMQLIYRKQFP